MATYWFSFFSTSRPRISRYDFRSSVARQVSSLQVIVAARTEFLISANSPNCYPARSYLTSINTPSAGFVDFVESAFPDELSTSRFERSTSGISIPTLPYKMI
jgi:hypothetical protein